MEEPILGRPDPAIVQTRTNGRTLSRPKPASVPAQPPGQAVPPTAAPVPAPEPGPVTPLRKLNLFEPRYTPEQKAQAIAMVLDEGLPTAAVASKTGMNLKSLHKYLTDERKRRQQALAGKATRVRQAVEQKRSQAAAAISSGAAQDAAPAGHMAASVAPNSRSTNGAAAGDLAAAMGKDINEATCALATAMAAAEAPAHQYDERQTPDKLLTHSARAVAPHAALAADADAGCPGPFQPLEDHGDHEQRPDRRLIDEWRERRQPPPTAQPSMAVRLLQSADLRAFLELPADAQEAIKLLLRLDAA